MFAIWIIFNYCQIGINWSHFFFPNILNFRKMWIHTKKCWFEHILKHCRKLLFFTKFWNILKMCLIWEHCLSNVKFCQELFIFIKFGEKRQCNLVPPCDTLTFGMLFVSLYRPNSFYAMQYNTIFPAIRFFLLFILHNLTECYKSAVQVVKISFSQTLKQEKEACMSVTIWNCNGRMVIKCFSRCQNHFFTNNKV